MMSSILRESRVLRARRLSQRQQPVTGKDFDDPVRYVVFQPTVKESLHALLV